MLLNDTVVVPCFVLTQFRASTKACTTQIEILASTRTPNAHGQCDICTAHIAVVSHTRLRSSCNSKQFETYMIAPDSSVSGAVCDG